MRLAFLADNAHALRTENERLTRLWSDAEDSWTVAEAEVVRLRTQRDEAVELLRALLTICNAAGYKYTPNADMAAARAFLASVDATSQPASETSP